MLVYRASDIWAKYNSVVTGYCILEKISTPKTQDEFISECKNRSVFTKDQLLSFYSTGYKTILHVLFLNELENKVTLKTLRKNKIIDSFSGLRLSTPLSKEKFDKILELGGQE